MTICAVIPAAGKGSRLGAHVPKILLPITERDTVWTILRAKLINQVDRIHVIVSPAGEALMRAAAEKDINEGIVTVSVQHSPMGMGDATFSAYTHWCHAETLLVLWGDQVFVSESTLQRALAQHANQDNALTIPLVHTDKPYVEYIFDAEKLTQIKQTREGDVCGLQGLADVGTFILSTTNLYAQWEKYLSQTVPGAKTQEINFLPFLPFLSQQGWQVSSLQVDDVNEARGINTRDDLLFFKNLYEGIQP